MKRRDDPKPPTRAQTLRRWTLTPAGDGTSPGQWGRWLRDARFARALAESVRGTRAQQRVLLAFAARVAADTLARAVTDPDAVPPAHARLCLDVLKLTARRPRTRPPPVPHDLLPADVTPPQRQELVALLRSSADAGSAGNGQGGGQGGGHVA